VARHKKYPPEFLKILKERHQATITQDLTTYASLVGQSFSSRLDQLAAVIGDVHHLSLGVYKERLLASVIRSFIPKAFEVGTGFVLFPKERSPDKKYRPGFDELNQSDYEVSKQCDILVYDAGTYPTVFQDEGFVVLRPEAVRTVVEVKGMLDNEEIDSVVEHFLDFGQKWQRCRAFYRSHHQPRLHQPTLCAIAWQRSTWTKKADRRQTALVAANELRISTERNSSAHNWSVCRPLLISSFTTMRALI
jgi:hypothetical protein